MNNEHYDDFLKALEKEFGTTEEYNTIEDCIRRIELRRRENLTPEEARLLEKLESRPMHPELVRTFARREGKSENDNGI
jgi:hypothetical protein